MTINDTVTSYAHEVREGRMSWHEAALELREMYDLTVNDLYVEGFAARLQAADAVYQQRLARARLARVSS